MPDKFVEFTNARTNQSVWVNPDHVRNAQAVPGKPDWTELAMGGKGQDVAVQGDPKSVLKELTEQRSPVSKSLTPPPPKRTPSRPPKPSFTSTDVSLRLPEVVWGERDRGIFLNAHVRAIDERPRRVSPARGSGSAT